MGDCWAAKNLDIFSGLLFEFLNVLCDVVTDDLRV